MLENREEYSGNGTRQITGRGLAEDSAVNSAEGLGKYVLVKYGMVGVLLFLSLS